jgi:transcriptional regulator GlxA family with amidase domain
MTAERCSYESCVKVSERVGWSHAATVWVLVGVVVATGACRRLERKAPAASPPASDPDRGAASAAAASPVQPFKLVDGAKNVGLLLFDDVFITEFAAPFDVYHHMGDKMNVFLVGRTMDPVTTYEGVVIYPHFSYATAPPIDVLVVPSGNRSTKADLEDEKFIEYVRTSSQEADYVTSHCWGAFTLAQAGVLKGKEATTFPTSFKEMAGKFPETKVITDRRVVADGNVITSNGGLAAFEGALAVVEKMYGREEADRVAKAMVFAPENVETARALAAAETR